jgi:hypothetical protein
MSAAARLNFIVALSVTGIVLLWAGSVVLVGIWRP